MKTKTINTVLTTKFNSFVASITDPEVRLLVEQGTIITGGCIVSMFQQEKVNDYDLYFKDQDTAFAVARYYVEEFKKTPSGAGWDIGATLSQEGRVSISVAKSKNHSVAGDMGEVNNLPEQDDGTDIIEGLDEIAADKAEGKKTPKYSPLFLSSNAITLSTSVQLIIRFYGSPEEIHGNYDFVHCTNYWTSWDQKLHLNADALACILSKELRYVGSRYPICSIIRTRKFINRGWTINAGQYVKMCWQVSQLDLGNIEVLKDQLVGVDSAYFNHLLSELRKEKAESGGDRVDGTYLITMIDKIFN